MPSKSSSKEEEMDVETLIANLPVENPEEDKLLMRSSKHDSSKRSLRSSQKLDVSAIFCLVCHF